MKVGRSWCFSFYHRQCIGVGEPLALRSGGFAIIKVVMYLLRMMVFANMSDKPMFNSLHQ
jgi:hypothetical protein